jgi:hypothetical protein
MERVAHAANRSKENGNDKLIVTFFQRFKREFFLPSSMRHRLMLDDYLRSFAF